MDNFGVNLNKIKQPEPNLSTSYDTAPRAIKVPYVGIISDINPTKTPVSDTIEIKKNDMIIPKFKPIKIKNIGAEFNNIATGGIIACGIVGLLSLIKKK